MPRPGFSIIVAAYGVAKYVDDCFESLAHQTRGIEGLEIIVVVDDGTPDRLFDGIERWRSRYPELIRCVRQSGQGLASARNTGLRAATQDWVTFIDLDDYVEADYFEQVERFLQTFEGDELVMFCTYPVQFDESQGRIRDKHPLRAKLRGGERTVPLKQMVRELNVATNTSFFRRRRINNATFEFETRVAPVFSDAHFIARYLLESKDDVVIGFVPSAWYIGRQQVDISSLHETSWSKSIMYDDCLRYGCLELLNEALKIHREVPIWLQRMILYLLQWYFRENQRRRTPSERLDERATETFHTLMKQVLKNIETATIESFEVANPSAEILWAMKSYKGQHPHSEVAVAEQDPDQRLVRVRYFFSDSPPVERFVVEGKDVAPRYVKVQDHRYFKRTLFRERHVWIPVERRAKTLEIFLDGRPAAMVIGWVQGPWHRPEVFLRARLSVIRRRLSASAYRRDAEEGLTRLRVLALRWASRVRPIRRRFSRAWLFMDRDVQADDNAEHLYRWVRAHHPEKNSWFVLDRGSHDWARLRADGFRLIPFGSWRHKLALLNADELISSHMDAYVVQPLRQDSFGDLMEWHFSYLRHGVAKHDQSKWFNGKGITLLITATLDEHESIVGNGSPYRYTGKEVRLTGFPRHDELLRRARNVRDADIDTILLAPTWRSSLVGPTVGPGNRRVENPVFYTSEFAQRWRELLHDRTLVELAESHGKRLVFAPHLNLHMYLDWFDIPQRIEIADQESASIQEWFARTTVLVTDYSSVDFEVALLGRSVIYYQFDSASFFGGDHWSSSYFDYGRHGFGPVCAHRDALLSSLLEALENDGPELIYSARMDAAFPYRDEQCCQRVYDSIVAMRTQHCDIPPVKLLGRPQGQSEGASPFGGGASFSREP